MSDRASPEDFMRHLDGEASAEELERADRHLASCRSAQEEIDVFRALGVDLRTLLRGLVRPQPSVWERVRERLEEGAE